MDTYFDIIFIAFSFVGLSREITLFLNFSSSTVVAKCNTQKSSRSNVSYSTSRLCDDQRQSGFPRGTVVLAALGPSWNKCLLPLLTQVLLTKRKVRSKVSDSDCSDLKLQPWADMLRPFCVGDEVRIQDNGRWSLCGVVVGISNTNRSYSMKTKDGRTIHRNRRFLKPKL